MAPRKSRTRSHIQPDFENIIPANEFGPIEQVPVLSTFASRMCLHHAGVHKPPMAGIAGTKSKGCTSIVMSGGYEDDLDGGDHLTYTGAGGRTTENGQDILHTRDQSWEYKSNAALKKSAETKKPVRAVRGFKSNSKYAPAAGYRYDGLYTVEETWMEPGRSGFQVCRCRLERLPDQPPIPRRGEGPFPFDHSRWPTPIKFPWINVVTGESSRATQPSDLPRPTSERPAPNNPSRPKSRGSRTRVNLNVDINAQPASGNAAGPSGSVHAGPSNTARADPQPERPPATRTAVPPPTTQVNRLSRHVETSRVQLPTDAPEVDVMAVWAEMQGARRGRG